MAAKTLAELKAAWKKNATSENNHQSNYYPFYDMEYDEKAVIRFLPDLNQDNPLSFIYEKFTHTLTVNGKKKNVPCLKMYGDDCPICSKSAEMYKIEGKETVTGKRLYRRKQNIAQILVVEDPLKYAAEATPAVGTVRLINMSYTLINIINSTFNDDELEELPWDYKRGTDFVIKKTKKGDYANYDLCKFARQERPLTDVELAAVEGNLIDLSTLVPAKPSLEDVLKYLDADLNGTEVEESSPSADKPSESDSIDPAASAGKVDSYKGKTETSTEAVTEPVKAKVQEPATTSEDEEFQLEADEIIAQLRRNRAQAADK